MKKHLLFFWALTVLLMPGVQSCDDSSEGGSAPAELTVTPNPLTVGADGGPQELSCLVENPNGGSVRASSSGATWIHSFDCSTEGKIFFYVDANPDYDLRTGEVIVTYEDAESVRLVVEQQGAEPPIGIRIEELTTTSARVTWEPDDASMTYILGVAERSVIDSYASGREMMEHDLEGFKADADSWGMSLSEYLEFGVLYTGKQVFPKDGFKPGTEYCAYAYGMDANGEFTTGLVKEIFETVAMTDCSFTIEPRDVTKNSVLLEVTPERNDVSYYVAYVERKAFENDFHGSDSELMQATVAQIRSNMALTGATWSDFVHLGAMSFPVASLLSGTDYYAFAFGLDRGAITTDISKKPFRTAAAELTDDCTFDIRFVEIGASTVDVEIVPSNSSTRYYATFMESSILETHTPDEVAAMKISEEEGWQTDWVNDPRIHSGTQTLNSNSDLGIAPFKPQHDYTVFVFGVSAEGERTTQVATKNVTTAEFQKSDMTIQIQVGERTDRSCVLSFTPSVDDELYYIGVVPYELRGYYTTDEEFMQAVVYTLGDYIEMYCVRGKMDGLYCQSDLLGDELKPGTRYLAIAFGYMSGVTTGLFSEEFTTMDAVQQ